MGTIKWQAGTVELDGPPPYRLPRKITKQLAVALLDTEPGDEHFIGELASYLIRRDKLRFRHACRDDLGKDVWLLYCKQSLKWAALINPDNKWHLEDFKPVYTAHIGSWWAHDVIITSVNVRFVTTPRGIFSFPEFELQYGKDIVQHIQDYKSIRADELDDITKHITADLIAKDLSVVDPEGRVLTQEFTGLRSQDPLKWILPDGYVCLGIAVD